MFELTTTPVFSAMAMSLCEFLSLDRRSRRMALARGEYAGSFVGAVESGGVLACQFHPELSGQYGHELMVRWLENGGASC